MAPTIVPLEQLVNEWLRLDPNPITRDEIRRLWDHQQIDELEQRMRTRIEFGTAGLRGKMEAGWARMNDLIVIQASQGLCAYVLRSIPEASIRGVVVGHDHRHNSGRWASLTAQVFISNNIKVYFHRGFVHTPLVPFSVKKLNAACGVMITASHNPKDDNGYKVYWENAVQSILQNLEPRIEHMPDVYTSPLCIDCSDSMKQSYFTLIRGLVMTKVAHSSAKFVNTSMHGVSDPFISEAFRQVGFAPCIPVEKQRLPDPNFQTVKFPNPEEKGALDLAISEATASGADYVLAQDPDADRFTAAERGADGLWFLFTGDQLGALFADHVLGKYKATGKPLSKLAMIASIVSSKMVEAMARVEGFKFVDCLTGFKFIGNTALDLVAAGYEVPFGYEEAIGFMFGSEIRDKDGVAATVMFAELVAEVRRRGLTVHEYLEELYQRYGYFETKNSYFICSDPVTIDRIFWGIRHSQESDSTIHYPSSIAGLAVNSVIDLTAGYGYDSTNAPSYQPRLPLSSGHMVQFRAQSTDDLNIKIVLTIRTSGTEPKIKYYLEGSATDRQELARILNLIVKDLAEVWMKASEHGLRSP
ncbi:hypothetical protein F5J12DRAFT_812762 [Pisolithus orientalis]|uniref:uncharacterized protein n=1 Tax=Pisolithus orientalis TaxID=936130 RepID=UPI002224D265|nr:uncharacterized protein F5J12DRAFT_812762 [Pisolithus orientalis]KAI6019729.1 hypothetical protein F5J12DRAFT_812762 [Pisolithus orientalis]